MPDVGFTHVALPVTDLDASIAFYREYTRLRVVHRRAQAVDKSRDIAWLGDGTRAFVLVLSEASTVERRLGPFAHLGVACAGRDEIEQLCALAKSAGCLREEPRDTGGPAGYLAVLDDPDGHTLELSYGQEVGLAVEQDT
jgi:catechol 2,3-dioxygenase-like lactoylglutathione lyase family enzyme